MRLRFSVLVWVMAAPVLTSSCGSDDSGAADTATVGVTVLDPTGLYAQTKYPWLFLFDGTCPSDEDLANGGVSSAFFDQKVPQIGAPFTMSNLDKKPMGFAAVFRKDNCGVVAFGCTPADLTKHKSITIETAPVIPPLGVCATCSDAKCK